MSEIVVPKADRPAIGKYVIYTVVGLLLVNMFIALLVEGAGNALIRFGGLLVAVIADFAIVFLMVQSLIEEWFQAATVTSE